MDAAAGVRLRRVPNPSHPLPEPLAPNEIGLMTLEEYLAVTNPSDKHHPESAYDSDIEQLNDTLMYVGSIRRERSGRSHLRFGVYRGPGGHVLRDEERTVAAVIDGVLYHPADVRGGDLPRSFEDRDGAVVFTAGEVRRVKYIEPQVELVKRTAAHNAARYPHVLSRVMVGSEPMTVRAERAPERDAGVLLAVLDAQGRRVAQASDEWGATLVMVARELRGRGVGRLLAEVWAELNPSYESGGYTPSGMATATRVWEARVSAFLSRGWYTELVKRGRLTAARAREIRAGLSGARRAPLPLPAPAPLDRPDPRSVRVLLDDFGFVVYDAAFIGDRDDRHVLARGFFRASEHVGQFLYAIDYEPAYRKLATYLALQMARDSGEPIYVGEGYGDLLELEGLEGVVREGDYARLTHDVLPLRDLKRVERGLRKPLDPYGEVEQSLYELSDSKWQ